ncbi:MAG: NUDIX hydrolase, partial [Pseudomonadota bacterium]
MGTQTAIPAATIILLRNTPSFQALMVERHADIGFAGGALVFPGGRVDPGDADPAWSEFADGLPANADMAAAMVAAVREAFEEVGVLFALEGDAMIDNARVDSLQSRRAD